MTESSDSRPEDGVLTTQVHRGDDGAPDEDSDSREDTGVAAAEVQPRIAGFEIERLLGRGATGNVYLARGGEGDRVVALKVLHPDIPEPVRRTILETARTAATFEDLGAVEIHSVIGGPEHSVIVMEHVEGMPIDRAVRGASFGAKARMLLGTARALAAAHRRNMVHGSLKPANILIPPRGRPKMLDLGAALVIRESGERARVLLDASPYGSPEHAADEPLNPPSDIFSFGIVMFEILTGTLPFSGETADDRIKSMDSNDPPFPRDLDSRVSEDLQSICLACLDRDPARRPTARFIAEDLGRYLAGEPVQSRPVFYDGLLRRRIVEHEAEVESWKHRGMIPAIAQERLERVYRGILAGLNRPIPGAGRISVLQLLLYVGNGLVAIAAAMMIWPIRDQLGPTLRWAGPAGLWVLVLFMAILARVRRDFMASATFFAGAIATSVPAVLALTAEWGILAERPAHVGQLFGAVFSNGQVLAAATAGTVISIGGFFLLRLTGFAWSTAGMIALTHLGVLLNLNWLNKALDVRALWMLPLFAVSGVIGVLFDWRNRVRWAVPFGLLAGIVFVGALDVIAFAGPTLEWLGWRAPATGDFGSPEPFLNEGRLVFLSFAVNGLVFLILSLMLERSRGSNLRRAARVLEGLAPVHLLGGLYAGAQVQRGSGHAAIDCAIYFAAVLLVLALVPWRSRWRLLVGALAGMALGSHLLVTLEVVPRLPFVIALGVAGVVIAMSAYLSLMFRTDG